MYIKISPYKNINKIKNEEEQWLSWMGMAPTRMIPRQSLPRFYEAKKEHVVYF